MWVKSHQTASINILKERLMRTIITATIILAIASASTAQEKPKWERVYTHDDAIVEMEVIPFSFGPFGRVRFRTVYKKPEPVSPGSRTKYITRLEETELKCDERRYRITEAKLLDRKGKIVKTMKADTEEWKPVRPGSMMERIVLPACRMIAEKKI